MISLESIAVERSRLNLNKISLKRLALFIRLHNLQFNESVMSFKEIQSRVTMVPFKPVCKALLFLTKMVNYQFLMNKLSISHLFLIRSSF